MLLQRLSKMFSATSPKTAGGRHYIGLDQGTLSSKICLVDALGSVKFIASKAHKIESPEEGHLQVDPEQIAGNARALLEELKAFVRKTECCRLEEISHMGITNQRETTVFWHAETGRPLCEAILWSDARTESICAELIKKYGSADAFKPRTGLIISTYFSLFKILWALRHRPSVAEAYQAGKLRVGTIDSWLMHSLLQGAPHVTDPSNASRTFLYNINEFSWDETLLSKFKLNRAILPEVHDSCDDFGCLSVQGLAHVRVTAVLGDQQAAAFGVGCVGARDWNVTFGTGTFLMKPIGPVPRYDPNFLTTILYHDRYQTEYALEGAIESGGININFLQNKLHLFADVAAMSEKTNALPLADMLHHKYSLGTLNGIFAPLWNNDLKSMIVGLSQHDDAASIYCAVLEGVAYRIKDVVDCISSSDAPPTRFIFNGGLSKSAYLRRFCAQLLEVEVDHASFADSTVLGVTLLSALYKREKQPVLADIEQLLPSKQRTTPETNAPATQGIKKKHKNYRKVLEFGLTFFKELNN